MGAPTNAANVKKVLANSEPSTHGRTDQCCIREKVLANSEPSTHGGLAVGLIAVEAEIDP